MVDFLWLIVFQNVMVGTYRDMDSYWNEYFGNKIPRKTLPHPKTPRIVHTQNFLCTTLTSTDHQHSLPVHFPMIFLLTMLQAKNKLNKQFFILRSILTDHLHPKHQLKFWLAQLSVINYTSRQFINWTKIMVNWSMNVAD